MDKEMISIVIAQNGLSTAALILRAKSAQISRQADGEKDQATATRLRAAAKRRLTVAGLLEANHTALTQLLAESFV